VITVSEERKEGDSLGDGLLPGARPNVTNIAGQFVQLGSEQTAKAGRSP